MGGGFKEEKHLKKLLLGTLIGAALVYFLDADHGAERRRRLTELWGAQRDGVLDLARSAGGAAGTLGQGVTELVDKAHKPEGNGLPVHKEAGSTTA